MSNFGERGDVFFYNYEFLKISFIVFTRFGPFLSFMVVDSEIWRSEWSDTGSMELVFRDVCVKVDKRLILNNVSGLARSGELLAVMGPSGKALIVRLSPLFNSFTSLLLFTTHLLTVFIILQNMTRKQLQIVNISQSILLYKLTSGIKRTLKQFLFSR